MPDGSRVTCNFRTGSIDLEAITFSDPTEAVTHIESLLRALRRFARAYADGVRSEQSYRLWTASEQAPPRMPITGVSR